YNREVNHINVTRVTNVYSRKVVVNHVDNRRISYNGGRDGIRHRPTREEQEAMRQRHAPPTRAQQEHRREAARDRGQFADHNQGRPPRMTVDDERRRDQAERRERQQRAEADRRDGAREQRQQAQRRQQEQAREQRQDAERRQQAVDRQQRQQQQQLRDRQ